MRFHKKMLKWIWKKMPASIVIGLFQALPDAVINRLGPLSVIIEPTTACNFSCPLCPRTKLTRKYGTMNLTNFKKVVDTLPWTVRVVELYLMGEPLLAKDIFEMIKHTEQRGIKTRISTNASYLERFTSQVLTSGLTELIVAVDGATEDTYKQYRVGGNFREVLRGIRTFVQERDRLGLKKPSVSLQFVVMRHNEHELDAVKALATELGADYLVLKRVALMNRDPKVRDTLKDKYLPTVQRFVRRSIVEGSNKQACRWAFGAVVTQDGKVTSCCYDWDSKHAKGNAITDGFNNVFTSPEYTDMRRKIIGQELDICTNCDYNNEISEYIKLR